MIKINIKGFAQPHRNLPKYINQSTNFTADARWLSKFFELLFNQKLYGYSNYYLFQSMFINMYTTARYEFNFEMCLCLLGKLYHLFRASQELCSSSYRWKPSGYRSCLSFASKSGFLGLWSSPASTGSISAWRLAAEITRCSPISVLFSWSRIGPSVSVSELGIDDIKSLKL